MANSTITTEWYSEALGRPTQASVLIPPSLVEGTCQPGHKYKTVYMLPGAMSSRDALFNETDLASFCDGQIPEGVIIVMITPTFSNYIDYAKDYKYAHKYNTYVTRELIDITRTLFPLSDRREDTAIYGLSMGGWGAFYCGLNNPQTYGYVGSQSGMLDLQWAIANRPFMTVKHKRQFGDDLNIENTEYDLYAVTRRLNEQAGKGEGMIPKIYHSWGTEMDYLDIPNRHMHEHMSTLRNLDYTCYPLKCVHGWGTHNEGVYLFLDWFLGRGKGGEK